MRSTWRSIGAGAPLHTGHVLVAVHLVAAVFVAPVQAVTLVEKSQPRAVVILPEKPSPVAEGAARVLRDHVRQMSGAELPFWKLACAGRKSKPGPTHSWPIRRRQTKRQQDGPSTSGSP
jgi:hypothetical protein